MAIQRVISSNAIRIAPSDTIEIPNPSLRLSSGTNTSVVASQLVDTAGLFATRSIRIGDIVYNTTAATPTVATVTSLISETAIGLSANIFSAGAQTYVIYQSSGNSGLSVPAILYVGATGNIAVETDGGQVLTFNSVPVGILNVFVRRVFATGTAASNIIALF